MGRARGAVAPGEIFQRALPEAPIIVPSSREAMPGLALGAGGWAAAAAATPRLGQA